MDETPETDLHAWKAALVADFARIAARDRWGQALMVVGWVHLGFMLVNQAFYVPDDSRSAVSLALWFSEVAAVVAAFRLVIGRGWFRSSPLVGVAVRVWATFLILSMNVATLNSLTGWSVDWFKLVWCTLSSFGFATMAWLFGLRFLIPAFQMYFTSLLIARYPGWAYLIFGLSWWAALQGIGLTFVRRGRRWRTAVTASVALGDEPSGVFALAGSSKRPQRA